MLIDFHTHAFPDRLACGAIASLENISNQKALTDGTLDGLLRKVKEDGVDKCVLLNIATNEKQQKNVNDFAFEANNNKAVYALGSVYPFSEDATAELERIKSMGLKGIKLHPEYQEFKIDDKRVFPVYEICAELGLVIVFHSGKDVAFPKSLNAHPKAGARIARMFPQTKMVFAHMGGFDMAEEVLEHMAGHDVYLDTAFVANRIDIEICKKIIKKHGAEKILFGSDCPWSSSRETFEFIEGLDLSDDKKGLIYYKNAETLLHIK